MKTITAPREEVLRQAAEKICALLRNKPDAVIALGANNDCLALYRVLSGVPPDRRPDFSQARFFSATAFEGLAPENENSVQSRLKAALQPLGLPEDACVFLDEKKLEDYDERIAAAGGLDLLILGIGPRGRIGFNEPATPYDSLTHRQKLTKATGRELAGLFGGEDKVPAFGLTIGIQTMVRARDILLIALGEERADPVYRMLYARDDSFVPAAFLQLPPRVSVYLDEAAAGKL